MDRTLRTGRFLRPERTPLQAPKSILQQVRTHRTKPVAAAVLPAAVQIDHRTDGPAFSPDSPGPGLRVFHCDPQSNRLPDGLNRPAWMPERPGAVRHSSLPGAVPPWRGPRTAIGNGHIAAFATPPVGQGGPRGILRRKAGGVDRFHQLIPKPIGNSGRTPPNRGRNVPRTRFGDRLFGRVLCALRAYVLRAAARASL